MISDALIDSVVGVLPELKLVLSLGLSVWLVLWGTVKAVQFFYWLFLSGTGRHMR